LSANNPARACFQAGPDFPLQFRFPIIQSARQVMASIVLAEILAATQRATAQLADNALAGFLRIDDDAAAFRCWVTHFAPDDATRSLPLRLWLARQIALIDELISEQLNAILHQSRLQELEAAWRSLQKLCDESRPYPMIRLRLLNVS